MGSIMWDDELEQALTRYGRSRVEEAFGRDPDNRAGDAVFVIVRDFVGQHGGSPPRLP